MRASPIRLRLYWETVRHLRGVQIFGRLRFAAMLPKPDVRPAPPIRPQGEWVSPARRRQSQIGPDEFCFLNEARSLSQHGWDDLAVSKLWRYNLHYFDDLNAIKGHKRADWHRALVERWVMENPPGKGTGWEPYPTSLRIVNWIKWARAGNALPSDAVQSLAVQARWLSRRLEHHLLGNHLFANAKALVFAGCYFDGAEAQSWLDLGSSLLDREIPEQILSDGGHFELSPMYHSLALEDMLDLVNMKRSAGFPVPREWADKITAMRRWLGAMSHPDDEIAFFNDAAIGIAPSPAEIEDYALRLGFVARTAHGDGLCRLRESGYIRLQRGNVVALLDVARVGPDYIPGHAHADTLSFELSIGRRRAIVNSGTSVYGTTPERLRQRGTAAHNTVIVDNENSSEVWSGFRVARRAQPHDLTITSDQDEWVVACSHDGYKRLRHQPLHRRTWRFGETQLEIIDKIEGGHQSAVAVFHFHPAFEPSLAPNGMSGELAIAGKSVLCWWIRKGVASIEPCTWHPEFGAGVATRKLLLTLADGESDIVFSGFKI